MRVPLLKNPTDVTPLHTFHRQSALRWQDSVHLPNPLPTSHSTCDRAKLWTQEQQASAHRLAHTTPVARDTADLERGECEGCTIAASTHNAQDNPGALRASGLGRPAESPQEGCPDDASDESFGEVEGENRYGNSLIIRGALALGVRGCPN